MKRFVLFAALGLALASGASAQIQVSREGYITTPEQRMRWLDAIDMGQQYCNKENLMRFTEPMQKEFMRAQRGLDMKDLASAERGAALCKQGYEMGKVATPVKTSVQAPVKGALNGVDMHTSTPRDIYMATATKVNQDRVIRLEKTPDWQMKVNPSYDCTKAISQTDIAICSNPYLSLLDQELSAAYKQAMANAKATGDPAWLQAEQRKWNKKLQGVHFASELAYRQATRINYLKDDTADANTPSW